jgi:pimeloyl-ACP methyl ester carboxylesterase
MPRPPRLHLGRGLRATRLLLGLQRQHDPARLRESRARTPSGAEYDLYQPVGRPDRTLIAVHGMTRRGERDTRLIQFARTFAVGGFRVAAVHLPGLAACAADPADVDVLCDAIAHLADEARERVGVVAFSFGGGLALTAAARAQVRDRVEPILLMGAYHDLDRVWDELVAFASRPCAPDAWDDYAYLNLVVAYRRLDLVPPDQRERVVALLEGYCAEKEIAVKRRCHEEVLAPLRLHEHARALLDPGVARAVSPAGRLADLRATALIVHDAGDRIIAPAQSRAIAAELAAAGRAHRLLVSSVVSHVDPADLWRVGDLARMLGMFGELWGG